MVAARKKARPLCSVISGGGGRGEQNKQVQRGSRSGLPWGVAGGEAVVPWPTPTMRRELMMPGVSIWCGLSYVELLVSMDQTCVGRGTVPLVFVVLWPGRGTWAGREGGWYSLPTRMERGPMIASVGMIRMMVPPRWPGQCVEPLLLGSVARPMGSRPCRSPARRRRLTTRS